MPKPQYGYAHQQERARWKKQVDAGLVHCALCGAWLDPSQPWDLDHEPGTEGYRGPACRGCNRADGATRGNQARRRGVRWSL